MTLVSIFPMLTTKRDDMNPSSEGDRRSCYDGIGRWSFLLRQFRCQIVIRKNWDKTKNVRPILWISVSFWRWIFIIPLLVVSKENILTGVGQLHPMNCALVNVYYSGIGLSNGFPSLLALMKSQGASKRVMAILTIGGPLGMALGPFVTTFIMSDNGKRCMSQLDS